MAAAKGKKVTLKRAQRYNFGGVIFEKDEPVTVTAEQAKYLAGIVDAQDVPMFTTGGVVIQKKVAAKKAATVDDGHEPGEIDTANTGSAVDV